MSHTTSPPLMATPTRRTLHRLLGPLLPYLLHLRPLEWPIMAAHAAVGWLLAGGFRAPDGQAWLGLAAWVVCLNGGTLALNSAFDRDTGDVAYLRHPPPPPQGLAISALLLMLAGLVVTWSFPLAWRVLYGASVLMSVSYSVPPVRLKAVAGADWLINMIGFGTLTPWAGWAITGRALTLSEGLVLWAFCPLFAALYPLTQLYQMDEDRARGDRTLVLRLGMHRALAVAIVATGIAFAMLAGAAWLQGWDRGAPLRWAALGAAALGWLAVLVPWHQHGREWAMVEHQRGMYHALVAWALTDVAVIIAWLA